MKNKLTGLIVALLLSSSLLSAQKTKDFDVKSQDGNITLHVAAGKKLVWSVQLKSKQIIGFKIVSKRSNTKAYRLRIHKKKQVEKV